MNRYLAEGHNWEKHLERTRKFIIECVEDNSPASVAILGSGWLLDIPFEFLIARNITVYLVDVVHPPQIINKVKKNPKIILVQADITGGAIEGAYNLVRNFKKSSKGSLPDIPSQSTLGGVKADFIISLNILNQLDILLLDYLSSYMKIPEVEKETFRSRIQRQHLELLPAGRSCLITDVEEKVFTVDMESVSSKPLTYTKLPTGSRQEEWSWTFDTRGEYNRGCRTEMLVKAIRI